MSRHRVIDRLVGCHRVIDGDGIHHAAAGGVGHGDCQIQGVGLRAAVVVVVAVEVRTRGSIGSAVPFVLVLRRHRGRRVLRGVDGEVEGVGAVVVGARRGVGGAVPGVALALTDSIGISWVDGTDIIAVAVKKRGTTGRAVARGNRGRGGCRNHRRFGTAARTSPGIESTPGTAPTARTAAGAAATAESGCEEGYRVTAVSYSVPRITAYRPGGVGLGDGAAVLDAAHGDDHAAADIEFLLLLAVGIEGHLG